METVDNNYLLKENKFFSKTLIQFIYFIFLLSIVLSALFINISVVDAETRAGTVIENTAKVVYTDQNDTVYQALSNKVTVRVSAVPGVDISPGTNLVFNSIETFSLAHTITNTGNIADYINLELDINQSWNYNIYIDINNNKTVDEEDSLLIDNNGDSYVDTGLIEPGDKAHILIELTPDESLSDGLKQDINVNVFSSINSDIKDEATNVVSINNNSPYIEIKQSPETVYSEQSYKYTIFYKNQGGNPLTNVVIENILPPELDYISSEANGNYITKGTTKKIIWTVDELLTGESGSFEVTVSADNKNNERYTLINEATMNSDQTQLISDKVSTEVIPAIPNELTIDVNPKIINGDGESTALFTVNVFDILGKNVPDGTMVTFETESGVFIESGNKNYIGYTKDGTVTAELLSPVLYGDKEINNLVTVTASDKENNKVSESVTITFIPGSIAGEIIDEQTNYPISGIKVILMNKNGEEQIDITDNPVYTNEQGRYNFIAPAINEYQIIYEIPDLGQITKDINVTELGGKLFYPDEALAGKVVLNNQESIDEENKLNNTTINIYGINDLSLENPLKTTTTNHKGTFIVQDFNNTSYPVKYLITAKKRIDNKLYFNKDIITFTSAGQLRINKVLNLYSTGKVYDQETGQAIEGAEVTLVYAGGDKALEAVNTPNQLNPIQTNNNGEYIVFSDPGSYRLKVVAEGYDDYYSEPFTTNGEPVNKDIALDFEITGGIELTKEVDKKVVRPGEKLNYRLKYKNVSGDEFNNIVLNDTLPQALIIDDSTLPPGVVYNEAKHRLKYNIEQLSPEQVKELSFSAVVKENQQEGVIVNHSTISDQTTNENYGYDTAETEVLKKGNITLNHFVDQSTHEVGDIVNYSVKIKNEISSQFNYTINDLKISVTLPPGFSYLKESSKINNYLVEDPQIKGNTLIWNYPILNPGEEIIITYKTKVEPKAMGTKAESKAYLDAKTAMGSPFKEGPAVSIVEVSSQLFSDKSAIFGRVFLDFDNDGIHDKGEKALENIKLILDNGTLLTTDKNGDYSHDLLPGEYTVSILPESFANILHTLEKENLKISENYLPETLAVLRPGNIKQFDFPIPVTRKDNQGFSNVQLKIKGPDIFYLKEDPKNSYSFNIELQNLPELQNGTYDLYLFTTSSSESEMVSLEKNHYKDIKYDNGNKINISNSFNVSKKLNNPSVVLLGAALYKNGDLQYLLKDEIKNIEIRKSTEDKIKDNIRRIIKPESESILRRRHIDLKVQGYKFDKIDVYLNSKLLDKDRIGKKVVDNKKNIKKVEYISVEFKQGENKIKVDYTDKEGNSYSVTENVYLPGKAEKIDIIYPKVKLKDNKMVELPIYMLLTDQYKLPALSSNLSQASIQKGDFYHKDDYLLEMNKFSENIYRTNAKIGSNNSLNRLMVEGDKIKKSLDIDLPDEKYGSDDMFGIVNFKVTSNITPQIKTYLRKKINNDSLLTFRLDSENNYKDKLFNIEDEDYLYKDYGDNSTFINNSSSSTGVYASIKNKNSYFIYGDIYTGFEGQKIVSLDSKLNGFKAKGNRDNKKYELFLATERRKQVTEEIIPEGISGYYFLSNQNIVPGSEVVTIKTKYENSTFMKEKRLFKEIDYNFNYKDGLIMFKRPIYRYVEDFGENIIELKYKVYSPDYETSYVGVNFDVINDNSKNLGVSYISESSSDNPIFGLNGSIKFNEDNKLIFETAWNKDGKNASRSSLMVDSLEKTAVNLSYKHDEGVIIPGEETSPDKSSEFNGEISRKIINNNEIYLNYNEYNNTEFTDKKYTMGLSIKNKKDQQNGFVNISKVLRRKEDGDNEALILTGEKKLQLNKDLDLTLRDNYLLSGNANLIESPKSSMKLNYKYSDKVDFKTTWYKRSANSNDSYVDLNLDYQPNKNLTLFTGYNLPLVNKRDSGDKNLNYGLNNHYQFTPRTGIELYAQNNVNFEKGKTREVLTASAQFNYTQEDIEASAKYEFKNGDIKDSRVLNFNIKGDINEDSSVSIKYNNYDGSYFEENDFDLKYELEANWAYRPVENNELNGFSSISSEKYQSKLDSQNNYQEKTVRTFSTDWIYKYNKKFDFGLKLAFKSISEDIKNGSEIIEFNSSILMPQFKISYKLNEKNHLDLYNRYIFSDSDLMKNGYSLQYRYRLSEGLNLVAGYNSEELNIENVDNKSWDKGFYYQVIFSKSF